MVVLVVEEGRHKSGTYVLLVRLGVFQIFREIIDRIIYSMIFRCVSLQFETYSTQKIVISWVYLDKAWKKSWIVSSYLAFCTIKQADLAWSPPFKHFPVRGHSYKFVTKAQNEATKMFQKTQSLIKRKLETSKKKKLKLEEIKISYK